MVDFAAARKAMVDSQIRTNDVTDQNVLKAFLDVSREAFVPESARELAYLDRNVPLGSGGRYLSMPMVISKLIQAADIGAADRVLVIGSATGYSAAIVARLAASVVALEVDPALAAAAAKRFADMGIANVQAATGPLAAGWPAGAPYDAIVVDGAVEDLPPGLREQLKPGGRLVAVLRTKLPGQAVLLRQSGTAAPHVLFNASAPLLPGFARPPAFVF